MGLFNRDMMSRLGRGGLALSYFASRFRSVEAVSIAASSGYDWIFLDVENTTVSLDEIAAIGIAAHHAGIATLVRVPQMELTLAAKILGLGAGGVLFPQVERVDEAEAIVRACQLPPQGQRSPAYANHLSQYGRLPVQTAIGGEYETLVAVMVETAKGVTNTADLAALDGIGMVMVGTHDLAADLGVIGKPDHESVLLAIESVAAAAEAAGKIACFGGLADTAKIERCVTAGARMILAPTDISHIVKGARDHADRLRKFDQTATLAGTGHSNGH